MMTEKYDEIVAKRELLFSIKGKKKRHNFFILVHKPFELEPGDVNFEFSSGAACCRIEFHGLGEPDYLAHGADTLQALALAIDIDPLLRGFSRKYDFFFDTGEDYFEEC